MDTAQDVPHTVIVAGDEAAMYLQATLRVVWAPKGETPIVKVAPGREHLHFYGALNLQTGQEVAMRSPIMNGATSVLFLHKLVSTYPEQPLLLLWDRAPWHQGPAIRDFLAAHPHLEIFYLPPGAPDLNPQEHVWKAVREQVTHNHTVTNLAPLADQFEAHLTTHTFPCSLLEHHGYQPICAMFI